MRTLTKQLRGEDVQIAAPVIPGMKARTVCVTGVMPSPTKDHCARSWNSLGAKSFRSRRQVCHSCEVPGER